MRFKIFKFKRVTSTNDVAINLIRKKKKEIGYVFANSQTNGRGTQGKKWISKDGNLFGSFFFPLQDDYPLFSEFAVINSVILSEVIKHFCKNKTISIKRPNDILVNGKKICGILQELITFSSKKFLIIGIGLNISSNPNITGKYKATNILLETNKNISIKQIMNLIVISYEKFFNNLKKYKYIDFKKRADFLSTNLLI